MFTSFFLPLPQCSFVRFVVLWFRSFIFIFHLYRLLTISQFFARLKDNTRFVWLSFFLLTISKNYIFEKWNKRLTIWSFILNVHQFELQSIARTILAIPKTTYFKIYDASIDSSLKNLYFILRIGLNVRKLILNLYCALKKKKKIL